MSHVRNVVRGGAAILLALLLPGGCAARDGDAAQGPGGGASQEAVEYWDLPTGSHLAYRQVAASPERGLPPLVLVHGGPGAYQVARFEDFPDWWQQLASLGCRTQCTIRPARGTSG